MTPCKRARWLGRIMNQDMIMIPNLPQEEMKLLVLQWRMTRKQLIWRSCGSQQRSIEFSRKFTKILRKECTSILLRVGSGLETKFNITIWREWYYWWTIYHSLCIPVKYRCIIGNQNCYGSKIRQPQVMSLLLIIVD